MITDILQETDVNEYHLHDRLKGEPAERHGAIGYMCIHVNGFRTKWYDSQPHLKSQDLMTELDAIIHALRHEGETPPFAGIENLEAFCPDISSSHRTLQTERYSYYFRFMPNQDRYDATVFAYDNRYLLPELAGQHKLPHMCFSTLPSSGEQIWIRRGRSGYVDLAGGGTREEVRASVDEFNARRGITKAQEAAMVGGSMFGWNTPAAKPWNYNMDGTTRPLPQKKKNEPER